ncbi:methyl-accepting chemotaxis protein [Hydrogenophaga sp. IBVHS2]|uniref:methyl-accepting chemotaxis protein n=1 Tax=Hydrogenophaga sp. IBVHS2 TaxID=1985170 RepID=UPI000A2DC1B9|nr:methyl-accepting chemotaxis protein [Hydrogenophaga sp. IBVHS2]OSZ67246.1 methyl-accepting chemotaxis protein [Hydrogenophaga sp. IBVHS2]
MFRNMSLAQRLLAINAVMMLTLLGTALTVWVLMGNLSAAANRINTVNVPQLQRIADIELNVTRVSLQLRHAILSRNPAEMETTLADIAAKRTLLERELERFGQAMNDEAGRQAFAPLPGLMASFWKAGEANLALIRSGQRAEAFAYLVDTTIPARNALLAPLGEEKVRQGRQLSERVQDIDDFAGLDRLMVVGAVGFASVVLAGLTLYLRRVTRDLGADPAVLKQVARSVAAGDLSIDIPLRPGDQDSTLANLKAMVNQLEISVRTVRQCADAVSLGSSEIASGNSDLSQRTESQASALEETSASMEQVGSTVQQNADNAQTANQLAVNASSITAEGGQVVNEVVGTMRDIEQSARRIGEIIGVIDGIAFQTNILALNAAVEAARAGEQGRGFAVVAGEVRNLAQRSAEAAKEVRKLIIDSVDRVEKGTALADRAGATMQEIVASIRRVSDIVGEISAASAEQSSGVSQVGEAITQMDQATQQNAALVEEMAAAASSLRTQARQMVDAVAVFRLREAGARAV